PTMSNINLFVNDKNTNLAKSGDTLRIVADVEDPSGVDKVDVWVRDWPYTGRQITSGQMSHVEGNTYEFEFTLPDTYSNGNPINETIDGNYFNFRPYDTKGNSTIGWRNNFTVDNTAPTLVLTDDGNPRKPITDGAIVNPENLGGKEIRFAKESLTDVLYVNNTKIN